MWGIMPNLLSINNIKVEYHSFEMFTQARFSLVMHKRVDQDEAELPKLQAKNRSLI